MADGSYNREHSRPLVYGSCRCRSASAFACDHVAESIVNAMSSLSVVSVHLEPGARLGGSAQDLPSVFVLACVQSI